MALSSLRCEIRQVGVSPPSPNLDLLHSRFVGGMCPLNNPHDPIHDLMKWDGKGWDGMGRDEVGWDGMGWNGTG